MPLPWVCRLSPDMGTGHSECMTQLTSSALDFAAVRLDLWEMSRLIPTMSNKTQKREASRTKTPNFHPNRAK